MNILSLQLSWVGSDSIRNMQSDLHSCLANGQKLFISIPFVKLYFANAQNTQLEWVGAQGATRAPFQSTGHFDVRAQLNSFGICSLK